MLYVLLCILVIVVIIKVLQIEWLYTYAGIFVVIGVIYAFFISMEDEDILILLAVLMPIIIFFLLRGQQKYLQDNLKDDLKDVKHVDMATALTHLSKEK